MVVVTGDKIVESLFYLFLYKSKSIHIFVSFILSNIATGGLLVLRFSNPRVHFIKIPVHFFLPPQQQQLKAIKRL